MTGALPPLWTIGHSTRAWEEFLAMLREAGIATLVDVRRFAGSRRHPQFSRDALPAALADAGIAYLPMPAMGGRRQAQAGSPNTAWRAAAFRAYADHLATRDYVQARDALAQAADAGPACVMCAEALWWRCHRRLIADDWVARGGLVTHLLSPGRAEPHCLHPDAVMLDGSLRYPADGGRQPGLL